MDVKLLEFSLVYFFSVDFELLAARHLSSDEVVGTSSVWLQSLAPRVETRLTLPLRQSADALPRAADACIDAHLTWMPVFGGRNLVGAGGGGRRSEVRGRRRRNMPVGVLVVQLSAGHSLKVMDSNGKSDPYVKFTIPGAHTAAPQFSSVCLATINPRWEPAERFEFLVGNSALAVLDIEVLDQDNLLETGARAVVGRQAVQSMGRARVEVAKIAAQIDAVDEVLYLEGGAGRIDLRLQWFACGEEALER